MLYTVFKHAFLMPNGQFYFVPENLVPTFVALLKEAGEEIHPASVLGQAPDDSSN